MLTCGCDYTIKAPQHSLIVDARSDLCSAICCVCADALAIAIHKHPGPNGVKILGTLQQTSVFVRPRVGALFGSRHFGFRAVVRCHLPCTGYQAALHDLWDLRDPHMKGDTI